MLHTMALKRPKSMSELAYYTRRADAQGKQEVWVFKGPCPKCGKGMMGKPRDPKTGKAKIRAKEYVCPECGHTEEKETYEDTLNANVAYTCTCGNSDEVELSFKRKKISVEIGGKKKRKNGISFNCSKCSKEIKVLKL